VGFVGGARNRESPCRSMETSKHTPNDANEISGGTTKTPGLPWHVAVCSLLSVLQQNKLQEIREVHNKSTVASGTKIAIFQA